MNYSIDVSNSSDIDICNLSPNSSFRKINQIITSTPHQTYKARVNFHSIESLAISSLNTSSSSPLFLQKQDDTGYSSLNSSASIIDHQSTTVSTNDKKGRRKLTDWQIWHLRNAYSTNRYPTPYEQEQLASQLFLPLSSIRIWFQNYRARSGRK
ncbi:hypothetical protein I4U23_031012 [Adineta vaga]|nr:hypothetical protein I4U23_031012 [Adineta vaga]